jgi:predicted nucleotidyltransferase component of viral defense system
MTGRNIAASVRERLYQKAKTDRTDVQLQFTKYALERLLYRLSVSEHRNNFLLKGALLFDLWFDVPFRPTRDIDLLGFGMPELPHLISVFKELCELPVDDGISFDPVSITAEEIREAANYPGMRIKLMGHIAEAECRVQIDIGYDDALTLEPELADYPTILDEMPAPQLRVYPVYTVVAEKLEAITSLGMANTRMKDYFDLWVILQRLKLDHQLLAEAFEATLKRRGTSKPADLPLGFSDTFLTNQSSISLWNAFITRNKLEARTLEATVVELREKLVFLFR